MEATAKFMGLIATFIGLLPSVIALLKRSSFLPEQKQLSVLVWGGTIIGIVSWYIASVLYMSNLSLLHIYNIFEFIMLSLIYRPYVGQKTSIILSVLYTVIAAFNSIYFDYLDTYNVIFRSISAFIFMFYALIFFAVSLKKMNIQRLEHTPFFWISCGVLFYYAASYFIFIFSRDILPQENIFFIYWGVHAIFTILLYLFYSIALWVRPQK